MKAKRHRVDLHSVLNVLFICGKNRWRSPTAEQLFADHPGIECQSAGLSAEAPVPVSIELIQWAGLICVMEKEHKTRLATRFKQYLAGRRVVCLGIPDKYVFMDPELVRLLRAKVVPLLPQA